MNGAPSTPPASPRPRVVPCTRLVLWLAAGAPLWLLALWFPAGWSRWSVTTTSYHAPAADRTMWATSHSTL